ncbi:MAG: lipid-A-disaccharide synthase [Drouetiella hepatica Uher 2000/2452]|jgi:lipid-A-disaccharide synthase|uniref:Lipid-A-disaccharide synthase n=1 Tax=Drouetiella hepatica Uher 2000/2452 TaxID=904376 RepID=A0A951Q6P0_9CYAN|nr:lipid-A-disaccharide synthase [Drouetiella hepatica Uher 2000/2452]
MQALDILILSNGPGELTTWVRPVVQAIRQCMGDDRQQIRISLVLSPCPNASGREVAIAQTYPEIDRVQGAKHFFPFLIGGKTAEGWDWRDRGVVVFLGGDQLFPVVIGKRLGYRTVVYGEWETRWHSWIDRFGVMKPELIDRVPPKYVHKLTVVGDLMAEASAFQSEQLKISEQLQLGEGQDLIGLLVGSKPSKLAQGVPLCLAIAHHLHAACPQTRFVIPVAPALDLPALAKFADPAQNTIASAFGNPAAELVQAEQPYLKTSEGLRVDLWTESPAHDLLSQCRLCFTTVGANTAELGSLGVPMVVMLPTQQLDAMRAWDGLPGLLANLPGIGTVFAKLINACFLWYSRTPRLLAWPNIWAGEAIVPELWGHLQPQQVAEVGIDWLDHPEKLEQISRKLRQVRGEAGAAQKLAQLVKEMADAQPSI